MFNFINIYIFIPVSGCVDRVPSALRCSVAYNAVKTALGINGNQGRFQDFKLGGALKRIAPSGGRRENFWGISCEKSRF